MIPQADYQMFLLTRLAEQSLKAVGPAGCLKLELAPVEINELAVSFAVKSYYFHIALNHVLKSWRTVLARLKDFRGPHACPHRPPFA